MSKAANIILPMLVHLAHRAQIINIHDKILLREGDYWGHENSIDRRKRSGLTVP